MLLTGVFDFNESLFFLPQTAQNDESVNLFCLVFLTLFLFAVFFLQQTQ